ncbi:MAG TPA: class I SAM-dependent methyltransferase [Cytophagaceae bacterium]|jgi:ubiquinone/menaquinone biosynthesis C-methylase UbiE|nr:class I SAM-dependent methyltransferase [Cytophagaceae bacterium]
MPVDFNSINKAFSNQSADYDEEDKKNPVLHWMRTFVYKHLSEYLQPNSNILELNAGTGIDAFYFASQGHRVHATDLSDGMVQKIQEKIQRHDLDQRLTGQQCSYTALQNIDADAFDLVFSNFGGLNCIPDLKAVTQHLPRLLKTGGYITWVIMPPVCPWELGLLLKGNFKKALRRLSKNGSLAHLEGEYFQTYYFTPADVMRALGKDFKKVSLRGLASFSPPPHKIDFPSKHPGLYKQLTKADEYLSLNYPFNSWADHFILTAQYVPQ